MTDAGRQLDRLERNLGRAAEHARVRMAEFLAGVATPTQAPTVAQRRRPQDTRLQRASRGGLVPLSGIVRLRSTIETKPLVKAKALVTAKPLADSPEDGQTDVNGFTNAQMREATDLFQHEYETELRRLIREG